MAQGKRRRYRLVHLKKKYRLLRPTVPPSAPEGGSDRENSEPIGRSRHELIAEAAYRRAVRRGFRNGSPEQDWYEAEAEIEELLRRSQAGSGETPES